MVIKEQQPALTVTDSHPNMIATSYEFSDFMSIVLTITLPSHHDKIILLGDFKFKSC